MHVSDRDAAATVGTVAGTVAKGDLFIPQVVAFIRASTTDTASSKEVKESAESDTIMSRGRGKRRQATTNAASALEYPQPHNLSIYTEGASKSEAYSATFTDDRRHISNNKAPRLDMLYSINSFLLIGLTTEV